MIVLICRAFLSRQIIIIIIIMSTSGKNFFQTSKANSNTNIKTSQETSKAILVTSPSLSSARNLFKFNSPSLKKHYQKDDNLNKENGFRETPKFISNGQEQSPLISSNYPHYRICKSSSESSSSSSSKRSPKINSKITTVKLHSMNEKQDAFQCSNLKRQTYLSDKQKRSLNSDCKHVSQNDPFQSALNCENDFASRIHQFDRDCFQRNSFNAANTSAVTSSNNNMNDTNGIPSEQYGKILSNKYSSKIIEEKVSSSKNDSIEWIEIMEPKSGTKMFANLRT